MVMSLNNWNRSHCYELKWHFKFTDFPLSTHRFSCMQLSRSLRTKSTDVSAEIRSARKKSREKVKSKPEQDLTEEVLDEEVMDEEILEPPTAAVEGSTGMLKSSIELPHRGKSDWQTDYKLHFMY